LNDNISYQKPASSPRFYYGYIVVAASFIIMVVAQGLFIVFGLFLNPLVGEFGWTRATISGAYSVSTVLSGVLGIPMGGLVDRFGPRIVVTACGVFMGVGHLLMSQVDTVWQIYLFYGVINGIGMSGLWVPLLSPLNRWFVARRSLMTGIVMSGMTIGGIIAPLVISRLIVAYDWRQTFVIIGSTALIVTVVFAQLFRRDHRQLEKLPPGKGDNTIEKPSSATVGYDLKEALQTVQFWLGFVILFCFGYGMIAVSVHLVPHITELDISSVSAADVMAVNGGVGIIGNFVVGGIIGDRIGNKKVLLLGFVLAVASLVWLLPSRELWMFHLFAVVLGIAMGSIGTSESPLVARLFGLKNHGLIYGVFVLGFTAGGAVGPFVTGYIHDVTGSYHNAFLVCIAFMVVGLILTVFLKPTRKVGMEL
jgi:OFA family oxalate/formate antiporter-like MFS transporter